MISALPRMSVNLPVVMSITVSPRNSLFSTRMRGDKIFVIVLDVVVLCEGVVQRLHFEKTGFVCGQHGARIAVAAKGPLGDAAVFAARPGDAPVVELQDFRGHGVDKQVDHVLIGEKIAAFDRVPGVQFETVAVFGTHHGGGAAFGCDGVGAHHLVFGDHGNVQFALGQARGFDGRAQPGQSCAENDEIMG